MGYYTHFKLELIPHPNNDTVTRIFERGTEITDYFDCVFSLDSALASTIETQESAKWYEHEKDMRLLSEAFPDIVFKLSGVGEESFVFMSPKNHIDIWIKYFKNGNQEIKKQ